MGAKSAPAVLLTSSPDTLSGTVVFAGTRVPLQNLFDHLEGGDGLDEFLDQFPSVSRDNAVAVLDLAKDVLSREASAPR